MSDPFDPCTITTPHDHTCPSCRIRTHYPQYRVREDFGPLNISKTQYRWLQNAARLWDELSPEDYPAIDFIDWLRFELAGERPFIYEWEGAKAHTGTGRVTNNRIGGDVNRHPDPLPYAGLKPVQK